MGQYPIANVEYRDPACPLAITLEAFSPFIPLNADASSLPATILRFTLKNQSGQPVEAELTGHLQNAVALYSASIASGIRRNEITHGDRQLLLLQCSAEETASAEPKREPIVFEDFEGEDYGKWTVEGTAFGKGPARGAFRRQSNIFPGISANRS